MSEGPTFDEVVYHLINNPDAGLRAQAAQMLGDHADDLDDDLYRAAAQALNRALSDPDPMVLMAAMSALGQFNRPLSEATPAPAVTDAGPAERAATCSVCGKPTAIADGATCEQPNCPYR